MIGEVKRRRGGVRKKLEEVKVGGRIEREEKE
jgi:hypothetical protein